MNLILHEKILYDKKGQKSDVLIPYSEYCKIIELLEDLDDINEMKEVESEETIPWNNVKKDLRKQGKL